MLLLCVCRAHITLEIQAPSQTFRSYCNTNKCNTMPSPWTDCKTLWRFLTELHYYTYTDEIIIYTLSTRPDRYSSHSFYVKKTQKTHNKPKTHHLRFLYDVKVQIFLYLFKSLFFSKNYFFFRKVQLYLSTSLSHHNQSTMLLVLPKI